MAKRKTTKTRKPAGRSKRSTKGSHANEGAESTARSVGMGMNQLAGYSTAGALRAGRAGESGVSSRQAAKGKAAFGGRRGPRRR